MMNDFTYKVTIRERDIARYMKDKDGVDKFIKDLTIELFKKALNRELRKCIMTHYGFNQEVFENLVWWTAVRSQDVFNGGEEDE